MIPVHLPARSFLRLRLTPVALVAVLGLAGCGGGQVEYQEVPGAPAEITLPEGAPAEETPAADGTGEEPAPDEAATPEPEATATPEADAGTSGAAEETTSEAQAEAPATADDGSATDQPPAPGADAERFEDFCEQNAGAC